MVDLGSCKNPDATADPDVVADFDLCHFHQIVFERDILIIPSMVRRKDRTAMGNRDVVSDSNSAKSVEIAEFMDAEPIADRDVVWGLDGNARRNVCYFSQRAEMT